jgi:hypothetical protein
MRRDGVSVVMIAVGVGGLLLLNPSVFAAEHGGKEHAGTATKEHGGTAAPQTKEHGGTTQEHGGQAVKAEPSAKQIRQAIRDHVTSSQRKDRAFRIKDDVTGTARTLKLVRVHERVGKTGELYYSCTDMQDTSSGELLDLDFDVDASGDRLEVVDVRIHKLEGQARYTYDDNDNRIPLLPAGQERTY